MVGDTGKRAPVPQPLRGSQARTSGQPLRGSQARTSGQPLRGSQARTSGQGPGRKVWTWMWSWSMTPRLSANMLRRSFSALLSGIRGSCWGSRRAPHRYRSTARLARGSADFSAARVVALDEYVGLPAGHPASFAAYVCREITEPLGLPTRVVVVPQGTRSGARAADPRAGRGRPPAARDRPQRPPRVQRAAVGPGLAHPGGGVQRDDPARQRARLRSPSRCPRMRSPRGSAPSSRRGTSCCSPPARPRRTPSPQRSPAR